jgi:flagellar biosynthesis protein FliP
VTDRWKSLPAPLCKRGVRSGTLGVLERDSSCALRSQREAHPNRLDRSPYFKGGQGGFLLAALLLLALTAAPALAQTSPIQITATPAPGGGTSYSVPIQTLLFFTLLTFLPAVLLMMTSFTRIIIVLSLLRMALGTQTTPPNQVLVGLAMFLTFFVMGPVFDRVHDGAYAPYRDGKINFEQALAAGSDPLKTFMLKHARANDLELFTRMARLDEKAPKIDKPSDLPLRVVIPAFVTSELKTAFQIGFMVFIPFLIIDLVVASVLMSMGMMMLSPVLIALPFKLMLFVLADGWNLLIGSLVASFQT